MHGLERLDKSHGREIIHSVITVDCVPIVASVENVATNMDGDVIRVPPDSMEAFLCKELDQAIRIQDHCCEDWTVPTQAEKEGVMELVRTKKRYVSNGAGSRTGKDNLGVFLHQDHNKRYFGILRDQAPVALTAMVPEAVKATGFTTGAQHDLCRAATTPLAGKGIEETLGSLLVQIPYISNGSRQQVLRASFARLDKDDSGELSRTEVATMIRRVVPKFSGEKVSEVLDDIDRDKSNTINYEEFLAWLEAHEQRSDARGVQKETKDVDVIHATFRTWDADGDGLISKKELGAVMKEVAPGITKDKLRQLWLHLDADKDDKVGYQEFVDFMFPGGQK